MGCPSCGYRCDKASTISGDDGAPKVGDYSVCLNCGELLRFVGGFELIRVDLETAELGPEATATVKKAQYVIRRRGPIKRRAHV